MYVPDFCATEAEFPSAEAVRINRYVWPRRNFLFEPFQVRHRSNSIDCFFDARARPLDSATAVRLYSSNKGHDQGCLRRIYDSRSQNDVRDHPHHRTDDSIRRVFSADLFDEQGKRIHGQPAAPEFLPRRARPRRVIVILSLVCQMLADAAVLPTPMLWLIRIGVPLSAILISAGFFFSVLPPTATS